MEEITFLRNLWYFAMPGRRLPPGKAMRKTMLGEPLLMGRGGDGKPFAMRNVCPHRGMLLSYGRFDGREVECCYHGWRFNTDGVCTAIPCLVSSQDVDVSKIRVQSYPCREVQGNVWVFFGDEDAELPDVPEIPDVPADAEYKFAETMEFQSDIDHAVVGLMDPAHGPYVHRSWWWRSEHSMHEKQKDFAPSHLGFCMVRHKPSSNSRAYKILGGVPQTEIRFQLPGVRFEHIQVGKRMLASVTAVTPITQERTEVSHVVYWTIPWLNVLKPVLRPFARTFLDQDRRVVGLQQEGLDYLPKLMMINDADVQARWYYRLKKEFAKSQEEGRDFVNPVKETTLRWRS